MCHLPELMRGDIYLSPHLAVSDKPKAQRLKLHSRKRILETFTSEFVTISDSDFCLDCANKTKSLAQFLRIRQN